MKAWIVLPFRRKLNSFQLNTFHEPTSRFSFRLAKTNKQTKKEVGPQRVQSGLYRFTYWSC